MIARYLTKFYLKLATCEQFTHDRNISSVSNENECSVLAKIPSTITGDWICRHWGVGEMNCIDCLFSPSWAKPYLSIPVTMTYSRFSLGRLALLSRLSAHWGLAVWYSSDWPNGYKYKGLGFIKCICIYYFWAPRLLDLSKSDQYFGKIRDHTFSVMLMSEKQCESPLRVVLCTVTTFLWSTYETLTVSHSFNWGPDFMDSCFMAELAVKSLQGLPSLSLNVS